MLSRATRERALKRALLALIALLSVLCLVGALSAGRAEAQPVVASYYGHELARSPTASGEPFNPYGFTAAHPYLPLGTNLQVCYQGCVTVRVNDRGPFVAGRGLDLSLGAAQTIGLNGPGVGVVDMTVIG
jgi:rare lipoprotein A